MAQVSLKSLTDEAHELIKRNSFDEAIAISRHILQHYPRCLEAYCLLGQACTGTGQLDQAADLFARALSVDPENVTTRRMLSEVYEAKGDIEAAVYQMRVAFDLAPSDREIRAELHRLIQVDGAGQVRRLKLTRQGLGRIYLRGGLYTQAADEFESLLHEDPEQLDVEASLAEALWRDGQHIRSVEVCQNILNKLPDCHKANLILGETWLRSDRQEEGEAHLQKVRAVDPDGLLSHALMGDASPIPALTVTLPPPNGEAGEDEPPDSPPADAPEDALPGPEPEQALVDPDALPVWLKDVETLDRAGLDEDEETPAWLQDAAEDLAAPNSPATAEDDAEQARVQVEEVSVWLPEWMREVEPAAATEAPEAPAATETEEVSVWLRDAALQDEPGDAPDVEQVADPEQIGEDLVPGWLRRMGVPGGSESIELAESEAGPAEETLSPADGLPDWLKDLEPADESPAETPPDGLSVAEETEDLPPWVENTAEDSVPSPDDIELTQETDESAPPIEEIETGVPSAVDEREEPAAQQPEVTAEETAGSKDASQEANEEVPEWLKEAWRLETEALPAATTSVEPLVIEEAADELEPLWAEEEEQIPDWLKDAAPTSADAPEAEATSDEDLPDWMLMLKEPDLDQTPSDEDAESAEAEEPAAADEELPDLMQMLREEPAEGEKTADGQPAEIEGGPADAETAADAAQQPPDWMHMLREDVLEQEATPGEQPVAVETEQAEVDAAPAEAEQKLPDWMQALREDPLESEAWTVEQPEAATEPADVEAPVASQDEELPDGMEELQTEALESEEMIPEQALSADAKESLAPDGEELPDWMRILREDSLESDQPAPGEPEVAVAAEEEELISGQAPSADAEESFSPDGEELPDWMRILREDSLESDQLAPGEPEVAVAVEEEELPDWMQILREEALEQEAPAADQPSAVASGMLMAAEEPVGELPDWMKNLREEALEQNAMAADLSTLAGAAVEEEDLPDWMRILREEGVDQDSPVAEPVQEAPETEELTSAEEPVGWSSTPTSPDLSGMPEDVDQALSSPAEERPDAVALTETMDEDGTPEWLEALTADGLSDAALPAQEAQADGAPAIAEPEPEWLRIIRESRLEEEDQAAVPVEPGAAAGQGDVSAEAEDEAATPVEPSVAAGQGDVSAEAEDEEPVWMRILREEGLEADLPSEEQLTAAGLMSDIAVETKTAEPATPVPMETAVEDEEETERLWGMERLEREPRSPYEERIELVPEERLEEAGLVQVEALFAEVEEEDDILVLPDWLRRAAIDEGLLRPADAELAGAAKPADMHPMVIQAVVSGPLPPEQAAAIPPAPGDWLEPLQAGDLAAKILPVEEFAPDAGVEATAAPEHELPTWLRVLRQRRRAEPALQSQAEEEEAPELQPPPDVTEPPEVNRPVWVYRLADSRDEPDVQEASRQGDAGYQVDAASTGLDSDQNPPEVEQVPESEAPPVWYEELGAEATAGEDEIATEPAADTQIEPRGVEADPQAIEGYEAALRSNPRDHQTRWKLALAYGSIGDHEAALTHSQELVQSGEMIGQVTQYLESTIREGVRSRPIYQLLGDAYFKNGMLEEAVTAYREALSLLY